jgi:hypothetical protein
MRTLLIGGAIAAIAVASVAAAAQPAPPPPPGVAPGTAPAPLAALAPPEARQMHVQMMSNHMMTRGEVSGHVAKLFAKLDTNRDGFVTKQEVEAIHSKMMSAAGRAGGIEKRLAERGVFMGDKGAMFDRLDTNHDGNISRQEFTAGRPQVREERVMIMRGADGAPGAPGALPPMDGHPGLGMEMHMRHMGGMRGMAGMRMGRGGFGGHLLEMADANRDGRVSLAEAQAAALAHFDKADVNHDGKITPDERGHGHQMMRIERRQG